MAPDDDFPDLLSRLRRNDQGAAAEIFQRFSERLVRVAARRMVGSLRRKVDPEDLVQSAFGSFFRAGPADAFELRDWESIWSLLVTIVLRKCDGRARHYLTEKRNIKREAAMDDVPTSLIESLSREPTPEEAAALADLVENLLSSLDEKPREVAELILQGFKADEIAPLVGLVERSVFRQQNIIRQRLAEMTRDDDEAA